MDDDLRSFLLGDEASAHLHDTDDTDDTDGEHFWDALLAVPVNFDATEAEHRGLLGAYVFTRLPYGRAHLSDDGVINVVGIITGAIDELIDGNPPDVWDAAQRCTGAGLSRGETFHQIYMVRHNVWMATTAHGLPFDVARYADDLGALPLPKFKDVRDAVVGAARHHVVAADGEVLTTAGRSLDIVYVSDRTLREAAPFANYLLDAAFESLLEDEDGNSDPWARIGYLPGDRICHFGVLNEGIVLTTRVDATAKEIRTLSASTDLAGFQRFDDMRAGYDDHDHHTDHDHTDHDHTDHDHDHTDHDHTDIEVDIMALGRRGAGTVWHLPEGWLDRFDDGQTIAVRVSPDGRITAASIDPPPLDQDLVLRIRSCYDHNTTESGLPLAAEDLIACLRADDRTEFTTPQARLTVLAEAAGLKRQGDSFAHDLGMIRDDDRMMMMPLLWEMLPDRVQGFEAAMTLRALTEPADGPSERLHDVLVALDDFDVFYALQAVLFGPRTEPEGARSEVPLYGPDTGLTDMMHPRSLATTLGHALASARKPREVAIAELLVALAYEDLTDPIEAERHLVRANEADPDFGPVIDRLAWYAIDRNDLVRARRLWQSIGMQKSQRPAWRMLEKAAGAGVGVDAKVGRNRPCPCGSGRKFKACHLGRVDVPPLHERTDVLLAKAVAFMHQHFTLIEDDLLGLIAARAGTDISKESMRRAAADPLVADLMLSENGWFESFLTHRGALLPADERGLADGWVEIERSVFEVVEVDGGDAVMRDLADDHRAPITVDVGEEANWLNVGEFACGRIVADGEGHRFLPGVFHVLAGTELTLLEMLPYADATDIADWAARACSPPTFETREDEPMVLCDLVFAFDDPAAAWAALDDLYVVDDEPGIELTAGDRQGWVEVFTTASIGGESIVRARMTRTDTELFVATNSDARADRIVGVVLSSIPGARLLHDDRIPLGPGQFPQEHLIPGWVDRFDPDLRIGGDGHVPASFMGGKAITGPGPHLLPEMIEEIQTGIEDRWCDEPVPALDGATPREAAADPTRRDQLVRLIDSFERTGKPIAGGGAFTFRPERLRQQLGL